MTNRPVAEPKRSVYDTCDPHYLRELRERSGIDLFALARTACLSVAQVKQLETDGSDGLFYSDAIKRQAYKRLLMILGAEPPTVELPEALSDPVKVAEAHLNTLDHIVAMSDQPAINRSSADVFAEVRSKLVIHWRLLGVLVLLAMAMTWFVLLRAPGSAMSERSTASSTQAPAQSPASVAVEPHPEQQAPVAAQQASEPAAVSSAATAVVAVRGVASCVYATEPMPEVTPFTAHKEGRYVYVVSPVDADLCVVDSKQQVTVLQFKAGENRTVYGAAPWQLSGEQLSKMQVFFQGGRVTMPEAAQRVKLIEVPTTR